MAQAIEVVSGSDSVQGLAAGNAAGRQLSGYCIAEDAAVPAPAKVILHNGTSAADPVIAIVTLDQSQAVTNSIGGNRGVNCGGGIYVERVSGQTRIVLYVKGSEP